MEDVVEMVQAGLPKPGRRIFIRRNLRMFGFFRWKKSIEIATRYCDLMLAGLDADYGRPIPNQVFGDAYVVGFFQQLILHSANEAWNGTLPDPKTIMAVADATFQRLVPGMGKQIVAMFASVNQSAHPAHTAYKVGQREGQAYVKGLLQNDEKAVTAGMRSFREFVVRNYLGGKYPA